MIDDGKSTDPIDVGAVRRDDAFLDDLAAGRATDVADGAEYEVAGLLAQWRSDSLAGEIPTSPTIADVEAAIARANERERERRGGLSRRLRVVSGAAAILAVVGAGLLTLSEGSQPGDPLWGVKQVVFSEEAQQTQARVNVQENIAAAKRALAAGDTVKASKLINEAEKDIGPIRDKGEVEELRDLINEVKEQNPAKLIPSLSSLPSEPSEPSEAPDSTVMQEPSNSSTTPPKPSTSTTQDPTTPSTTSSEPRPSTTTTSAESVTSTPVSSSITIR